VRSRLAEYAILQANGMEPNDIRRGLALEQLLVVLFALLIGAALAAVAVAVLLPSLQFGSEPSSIEPPTVVRIDWAVVMIGLIVAAASTVATAWLTRRLGARVDVVSEVRKLG
jgi:ABC-type antimicrobial peptide transport system permease subunit